MRKLSDEFVIDQHVVLAQTGAAAEESWVVECAAENLVDEPRVVDDVVTLQYPEHSLQVEESRHLLDPPAFSGNDVLSSIFSHNKLSMLVCSGYTAHGSTTNDNY